MTPLAWLEAERLSLADLRESLDGHEWRAGPYERRGPVRELLLVATGRPAGLAGLAGLAGTGVDRVGAAL
jgi:hypothetical protein